MTIRKEIKENKAGQVGDTYETEYLDYDVDTEDISDDFRAVAERLETTNEILFRMLKKLENVL